MRIPLSLSQAFALCLLSLPSTVYWLFGCWEEANIANTVHCILDFSVGGEINIFRRIISPVKAKRLPTPPPTRYQWKRAMEKLFAKEFPSIHQRLEVAVEVESLRLFPSPTTSLSRDNLLQSLHAAEGDIRIWRVFARGR